MNMLFYILSAFSVATFALFSVGKPTLPVIICKRNSTDFSACLTHSIQEAWPRLSAGLAEFDFPILDPLVLEHVTAKLNFGEIRGKLDAFNLTGIGLSKIHFSDVRAHFLDDVFRLEIDMEVPLVFVEGTTDVNGSLNIFKITGKGYFNATLHDVRATWDLTGHVVNDTWIVERFRIVPSLAKFKIYFDNLLEQGKEFNDFIINFVNEYWPVLYRIILPVMADIWEPWLIDIPNKIFSKVAFSEIFP